MIITNYLMYNTFFQYCHNNSIPFIYHMDLSIYKLYKDYIIYSYYVLRKRRIICQHMFVLFELYLFQI